MQRMQCWCSGYRLCQGKRVVTVWNSSGSIRWGARQLDRPLIHQWLQRARLEQDPAAKFVFSFIVLNHYYSAAAAQRATRLRTERDEMIALQELPILKSRWPVLAKTADLGKLEVSLPLRDRAGRDVPDGFAADTYRAAQLSLRDCLSVVYQLRCNLFHAVSRPTETVGNVGIRFAAAVSYALAESLVSETT